MSKMMLLLPNLQAGGAQRALLRIAKGEAQRGHEVHIVLLEREIEYPVPEGVSLHVLARPGNRKSSGWIGRRVAAFQLRRWHRRMATKKPFGLIIASLPFAQEVARLAGLPNVWNQIVNTSSAEIQALGHNPRKAKRRLARYRWLWDGQLVIAISDSIKDDLLHNLKIFPRKIVTIYNPFDIEEMRQAAKAESLDSPIGPYVLHVGRFAKQKRQDLLLDAFIASRVPHQLVIVTRDQDVGRINALVAERGLESRVTVLGFRDNLFPLYAGASALVLSSDFEGMPNVVIEALAVGTPVVSTDCPSGAREVFRSNLQKYLAPCGDAQALGQRLREVTESSPKIDPEILAPFSIAGSLTAIESLVCK
jgi:glycosyltransferase involved in cell wall biosynthesis